MTNIVGHFLLGVWTVGCVGYISTFNERTESINRYLRRINEWPCIRIMASVTMRWSYGPRMLHAPRSSVIFEKLSGFQLVKKFRPFYETRRFITALTSALHLSLSWASSIHCMLPRPTSWRSILILSSRLRLGLPSGLFPSGFPTQSLYTPLLSVITATCPAHLILLDSITRTILVKEYRSLSYSLCND